MYNYKRNGFTLVELMAVIIIISLIALLTFPNIINQIKKTKKSNNKMIEDVVIEQAKKYVDDNKDKFDTDTYCIKINELIEKNYVKKEMLKASSDNIEKKYVIYHNNKYVVTTDGYEEVDYIESTGTQYIDTEVLLPFSIDIKAKYNNFQTNFPDSDGSFLPTLFGCQNPIYPYYSTFVRVTKNGAGNANGTKCLNSYINQNSITDYNVHIIQLVCFYNHAELYLDNSFKGSLSSTSNYTPYSLYLFATNIGGTAFQHMSGRIYYVKFYSDTESKHLIRDFIPVLDKNGVACLYEKVEGKFYYNQGTGEFLYG